MSSAELTALWSVCGYDGCPQLGTEVVVTHNGWIFERCPRHALMVVDAPYFGVGRTKAAG